MNQSGNSYKIYLDVCCLNRPFDDWNQERVRWEGEAVLSIIKQISERKWQLISSEAIDVELKRMRDLEKLEEVLKLLEFATVKVNLDEATDRRSQQLESLGFGLFDSFHIACAEIAQADILLSTDDRLLKNVSRHQNVIMIIADNPVTWLMKVLQT